MKAGDQVFVGIPGTELDSASAALLAEHQPGGLILFRRNIESAEQLNHLVTEIRRVLPDAVLTIDAEGGRVDRLREIVGPAPAAGGLARHPAGFPRQAGARGARA